ncbi:hypothetical protein C0Q70_10237 [Pomacea canaliculata]|uniref:Uncharacterized protein n=1 Tax=Pomacea canaliculata TaxID=400727 RepID=A0A2T7PC19_POMCA|nr:hypothetical protein C0Q70_10237 [Pomacea canaliculata]
MLSTVRMESRDPPQHTREVNMVPQGQHTQAPPHTTATRVPHNTMFPTQLPVECRTPQHEPRAKEAEEAAGYKMSKIEPTTADISHSLDIG